MKRKFLSVLRDEDGSLQEAAWVIGAAVVVVVGLVAVIALAPGISQGLFNDVLQWIRSQLGL